MSARLRAVLLLLLFPSALLLTACAGPSKLATTPPGIKGQPPPESTSESTLNSTLKSSTESEAIAPPDSLQADVSVTPRERGLAPFSVRVYAKPNRAYRIDAFGFPSVIAASYLWTDGHWMWVRHDQKQVMEGEGTGLEMEGSSLHLPDVHAVLGFLWGRALPGYLERDSSLAPGPAGEIRWIYHGEAWEALVDPATGLCREARTSSLALKYGLYERHGSRMLPGEMEIFVDGASVMLLRLRSLNDAPVWRKNPFVLLPPPSYNRR